MSNSLGSHRLQPTRLLCPWDFPGKNTGVGCCSFPPPLFFKNDFFMWTILKVFIEFVITLFMFYVLFFLPRGLRDLSSSDQGLNPNLLHWKAKVLTTGPPGKLPSHSCLKWFIRKVLQTTQSLPSPSPPHLSHHPHPTCLFWGPSWRKGNVILHRAARALIHMVRGSLSAQFSHSVISDSWNASIPGLPVCHRLPKFTQTHLH